MRHSEAKPKNLSVTTRFFAALRMTATAVALWIVPFSANACSVCFGRDAGQAGFVRGFFWGVLLLLLLPLGLIVGIGGRIFLAARRKKSA